MEMDIHKLAAWIEKVCHEGIAEEQVILEWRLAGKPSVRQWVVSGAEAGDGNGSAVVLAKAS